MDAIEAVEKLCERGILYSVLIECSAAPGGKSWTIILSDNHGRKGKSTSVTLLMAMYWALVDLNVHCGGQISNYIPKQA